MKKIANIIISIILILTALGILAKIFIYDPYIEKLKKEKTIELIHRYYEKEEYKIAGSIAEKLLIENAHDKELIDLLDRILALENEKNLIVDIEKDDMRILEYQQLIDLIRNIIKTENKRPIIVKTIKEETKVKKTKASEYKNVKKTILSDLEIVEVNKLVANGMTEYNNKNYAKAKDIFLNALKIDNRNPYANAFLGAALFEENPEDDINIEKAVKMCRKAIKEDNIVEMAHYTLARIYNIKGLKDLAIEEYRETLKINPNHYESCYALGNIYYRQEEYKKAENQFLNAVKIKNDFVNGYFYLADTEIKLKKKSLAKKYFEIIIALDPDFYRAYSKLGEIYKEEYDYVSALSYYEKAVTMVNRDEYRYRMGECYEALDQFNKAVSNYLASISLNPLNTNKDKAFVLQVYEKIVSLKCEKGRYAEALKYVKEGLALDKNSAPLYFLSGFAKTRLGKSTEAVDDYVKVVHLDPEFLDAYYNLGEIYFSLERYNEAKSILTGLKEKQPDYAKLSETNEMLLAIKKNNEENNEENDKNIGK